MVVQISERGAQLECPEDHQGLREFMLFFTTGSQPVFRHCRRKWMKGIRMGVEFLPKVRAAKPAKQ